MSFNIEILEPTGVHSEDTLQEVTQFLFASLGKYGDPAEDIRKAINYGLSQEPGKGGKVLVMRDLDNNNQITGAVVLNETGMQDYIPENILVYIAVDQNYRGAGLGKQLMTKALSSVKGSVALHVEPDNPAKGLYERLGFENKYLEMRWNPNT